ncbi:MAG: hypothetical protein N2691_04515 [Patescibacteria group bacterium]|nr:hypothetical protein [Patescibacteria group bacterium]
MVKTIRIKGVYSYLTRLGLSEIEGRLYVGLLKRGSSTVMELANYVGIKRITAHFNIESLISKGLVTEIRKGARRKIVAEPPDQLKKLIKKREAELEDVISEFPQIVQNMQNILPKTGRAEKVEVRFFEGANGIRLVYEEALNSKMIRSYLNFDSVSVIFPESIDLLIQGVERNKELRIQQIVDGSDGARNLVTRLATNNRYRYKFASAALKLTVGGIFIFDGNVAVINPRKETGGVILTCKDYYITSKEIFNLIWQILPE